jgi:hypothetical protein
LDDNPWPGSRDLDDCSEETHLRRAYETRSKQKQRIRPDKSYKKNAVSGMVYCWGH